MKPLQIWGVWGAELPKFRGVWGAKQIPSGAVQQVPMEGEPTEFVARGSGEGPSAQSEGKHETLRVFAILVAKWYGWKAPGEILLSGAGPADWLGQPAS